MLSYIFFKYLHILCVAASFALFFMWGLWTLRGYPPPQEFWLKVLPYAVDTLLVLSAIAMIAIAPRWEWSSWIQSKLGMVLLYAGMFALVFIGARPRWQRSLAWSFGLLLFLLITSVAVLKSPGGVFSVL